MKGEEHLGHRYTEKEGHVRKKMEAEIEVLHLGGLPSAGQQALCLPSLETKERAWNQQWRHQWLNGRGSLHVGSKVLARHPTLCGGRWAGHGSSIPSWGTGRLSVIGGTDVSYQGNQQRGMPFPAPLISYQGGDVLVFRSGQSLAGPWDKYVGRSVL